MYAIIVYSIIIGVMSEMKEERKRERKRESDGCHKRKGGRRDRELGAGEVKVC